MYSCVGVIKVMDAIFCAFNASLLKICNYYFYLFSAKWGRIVKKKKQESERSKQFNSCVWG